jgi:hypothetical protein
MVRIAGISWHPDRARSRRWRCGRSLLAESWRQQPGTPVYTTDLPVDAARQALADAAPEQTARWRS